MKEWNPEMTISSDVDLEEDVDMAEDVDLEKDVDLEEEWEGAWVRLPNKFH